MSITYKAGKTPHPLEYRMIFRNIDREGYDPGIETYLSDGGYESLRKAITMAPADIQAEVKTAGSADGAARVSPPG